MRQHNYLSILFVAIFLILATNNEANAQPESFTDNYLMENYRGEQIVSRWLVQVTWDATANKISFANYYVSDYAYYSPAPVLTIETVANTVIWDETNTHATFKWREHYYGEMQKDVFVYYKQKNNNSTYKWFFGFVSPASVNSNTSNPYTSAFDGSKPAYGLSTGYVDGTIDLENEVIIMGPWGHFIRNKRYEGPVGVVEYFERSVLRKTDLVDIVNDGTVGEDYTINDDLVGITTVDGVLSAPMGVSRNENSFMIDKGRYKLDLDVSTTPYTLTVSQSTADLTGTAYNGSYTTYYILGQANTNNWDPTQGQTMATTDGKHYSAVVDFDGRGDNQENYFSITDALAENNDNGGWSYVNGSHRFGPSSNNYPVTMGDVLFAKDMGKYKYPSEITSGQVDFMGNVLNCPVSSYDQSNWVMLTGVSNANNYVGKIVKGKSITGKLVDKVNPTIAVNTNPTAGESSQYTPNLYIMPSFNEAYYASDSHYFFVAPKVQEYANITWACYNEADGKFYVPNDGNDDNLSGGIAVSWDYLPNATPHDGYVYEFDAIMRKVPASSKAPILKDDAHSTPNTDVSSADYLVYPLRLTDVPTAINTVETTGKVVDVKYYNMMGVECATPFEGVNIVVKVLDNGSIITSKKLYK